ncbi:MAG: tRNA (adenosine(37)-N6)-threonylcarbamoyltransferase complex dimerization subunit type 1 TsaB [Pseudomonadota bacterium]
MPDTAQSSFLLALDTSGPACSVALADCANGKVLSSVIEPMVRGHAEALVPLVERLLCECNASFQALSRIAVCIGPGSFAGLRVGLSAAKGYAVATDCEIVGISAFEAHARDALNGDWIALDGRRGEVFMQRKGDASGQVRLDMADLPDFDFGQSAIHGPFAIETVAAANLPADRAVVAADTCAPGAADIEYIAGLGIEATPTSHPATLNYMRGADAKPGAGFSIRRAS